MNLSLIAFLFVSLASNLVSASVKRIDPLFQFRACADAYPDQIWSPTLSSKARAALVDFNSHRRLPGGLEYGWSVRRLRLNGKSADDIAKYAEAMNCTKQIASIENPDTKQPILREQGQTTAIVIYVCPDGGVLRLKLRGDPTSRYLKKPHASKGLRYPYDASFSHFSDEILKIDDDGRAIPKWTRDLNQPRACHISHQEFIQGWALDAHRTID